MERIRLTVREEIEILFGSDKAGLLKVMKEMGEEGMEDIEDFFEAYRRIWGRATNNSYEDNQNLLCPKCGIRALRVMGVQMRSADEGESQVEVCKNCEYRKVHA